MFSRISLRRSDADQVVISTEMEIARKGAHSRVLFAAIMAMCALLWIPPWIAAAFVAVAGSWERWGRPWITARGVANLKSRAHLRLFHRTLIFLSACYYALIPLTGVLSGERVGWLLAIMAFCSAVIIGVTYFSNDGWQFSACILPSTLVASAAPFVFGVGPEVAVVTMALNGMFIMSALQSALHRAELVESISRKEAARSRAESASIEKSQFIANVSHELRTPLNAIIGYSEMLREQAELDARTADIADIDRVLSASGRLLSLINELLDISKIEAGKLVLDIDWYDADEMIRGAVAVVRPMVEANGNHMTLDLHADLGRGVSDEFRLSQCVLNLLSNAAKFTRDGDIVVSARRALLAGSEHFIVTISDTGVGIAAEAMERLFEPFSQVDASVTRKFGGTGLGLAITRQLARLLGGDVTVESASGRGSTFTLTTPVVARGAQAEAIGTLTAATAVAA